MFPYRQKAYLTRDLVICKISFHFYLCIYFCKCKCFFLTQKNIFRNKEELFC